MQATYKNKMKTYCVKGRKDTENIEPKMVRTKNKRFVREQKATDILSNLRIKTPLSKIPLLNVLF